MIWIFGGNIQERVALGWKLGYAALPAHGGTIEGYPPVQSRHEALPDQEGSPPVSPPLDMSDDDIQELPAPESRRTTGPTRRSTKGQWTTEESLTTLTTHQDEILRRAVHHFKGKHWKKIAECFEERTDVQCLHRWQKVLNPELVKGPWSKEEDEKIIELMKKYGARSRKWSIIAKYLPGRIGKQCRERWYNHLNPAINKEAWTQEEELSLVRAHKIYGNRWAELKKFLPGSHLSNACLTVNRT